MLNWQMMAVIVLSAFHASMDTVCTLKDTLLVHSRWANNNFWLRANHLDR